MTRKPDFAERNSYHLWDLLDDVERTCLMIRFKDFKHPGKQLPPMETGEEIAEIMTHSKDVRR